MYVMLGIISVVYFQKLEINAVRKVVRFIPPGAAFLPASISYLIGTNIFGPLAHKMGR